MKGRLYDAAAIGSENFLIARKLVDPKAVQELKAALTAALAEDEAARGRHYPYFGMVHALMSRGEPFLRLLGHPPLLELARAVLGKGCIIYAYNSSSMPPHRSNYSRAIHVDSPRLVPGYITNLAVTIALDPFRDENGAMEIAPTLAGRPSAPTEEEFLRHRIVLNDLEPGDAIFFNARCWHRGGVNSTGAWRHAVTMNLCRAYMRTQFDYPSMLGAAKLEGLSEDVRQLLGAFVRMPKSLDEFLLPPDSRPYRPGQE
ncbi:MAG: phytanoyl-CoA dioxygenase family protein [Elusimicrobia bacterium]|nr:phytanoyl-CoA dioxygenase family protein [Elusimicrobiota bacterium]